MKISFQTFDLQLRHTFTISRGSEDVVQVLILSVEHDGIVGYGETSPTGYYGYSLAGAQKDLEELTGWLSDRNPAEFRLILAEAAERLGLHNQALCALDLALHDWAGKKLGIPVYRMFGLADRNLPATSYTIGIDTIEKMVEKLEEFGDFPIFKIKLGSDRDLEIVRALRRRTRSIFRVDANCGWSPEQTIEYSRELKSLGVEFIEQPLPPESLDAMEEVYAKSALPIVADENSILPKDVPGLAGRFHGINVKLVKCGGLQPALQMIGLARTFGMKIMVGCMIESSNCCTAAAHLGSQVDYFDLDGPILIGNDPFEGMKIDKGAITLPAGPGLGVRLRDDSDEGRSR